MPSLSAENYFKKGLAALVDQKHEEASTLFRKALDLDRERNRRQPDMRYLSYYGLSLAMAGLSKTTAIQACRTAVAKQSRDPVLYLNLGRVYSLSGKVHLAAEAFQRGLLAAPDSKVLARELEQVDRRARPVLPMLPRNHALNRCLGRLRSSIRPRHRRGLAQALGSPRS